MGQQRWQLLENVFRNRAIGIAHKQFTLIALLKGVLRNSFIGQWVIILLNAYIFNLAHLFFVFIVQRYRKKQ